MNEVAYYLSTEELAAMAEADRRQIPLFPDRLMHYLDDRRAIGFNDSGALVVPVICAADLVAPGRDVSACGTEALVTCEDCAERLAAGRP